jgi:hypothetical protein
MKKIILILLFLVSNAYAIDLSTTQKEELKSLLIYFTMDIVLNTHEYATPQIKQNVINFIINNGGIATEENINRLFNNYNELVVKNLMFCHTKEEQNILFEQFFKLGVY